MLSRVPEAIRFSESRAHPIVVAIRNYSVVSIIARGVAKPADQRGDHHRGTKSGARSMIDADGPGFDFKS